MASIGAEVGQKMRSAIKAKLLELNCYVDDELPDYVMVMVANKRTKTQMKEDLHLFLAAKTGAFVDWLHIVLKKLKEVTVTNPEVYKKATKRKSDESANSSLKKEKKDKKAIKAETDVTSSSEVGSLTDDLPINVAKQRKIVVMKENQGGNQLAPGMEDDFDIPLLSEVNMSTEEELEDIERKIQTVKSRLGIMVESDPEPQADCIDLKTEHEEFFNRPDPKPRKIQVLAEKSDDLAPKSPKRIEKTRITFDPNELEENSASCRKKKSILDRLGKRHSGDDRSKERRNRVNDFRRDDRQKEHKSSSTRRKRRDSRGRRSPSRSRSRSREKNSGILSRLGVMSKILVPEKAPIEEDEVHVQTREVPSVVKVKPRVFPQGAKANKNLLLKAVAEAQKSVAQTPKVGIKPDALFTKSYQKAPIRDKVITSPEKPKPYSSSGSESDEDRYIPKTNRKIVEISPKYIPSAKGSLDEDDEPENGGLNQKFIVTLDGIDKSRYEPDVVSEKPSIKSRLADKKTRSPIIFDAAPKGTKASKISNIPDKLPVVHAPPSVKNRERCKYWPGCRQGDKCEFVHPASACDKFPHCKFGEQCLFLHPACKFASSCTRRDCAYSHGSKPIAVPSSGAVAPSICKFFPNCGNLNCPFYHPKPCKFGKYCKNQAECNFAHNFVPTKGSLTWRSK